MSTPLAGLGGGSDYTLVFSGNASIKTESPFA
jgi:hypothetical protein